MDVLNAVGPEVVMRALPPNHKIYMFSDLHEGSILKDKSGVNDMINAILSDRNSYAICGGDLIEGITIDDKRYQFDQNDPKSPSVADQYLNAAEELRPIKDRLLGILEGNHDHKFSRKGYGDFVKTIVCKTLGVPYGTRSAVFQIRDKAGKCQYKIFYHHGFGQLNSMHKDEILAEANKRSKLRRMLRKKFADCVVYAIGHTHQLLVQPPIQELELTTDDEGKILRNYRTDGKWYINTGSFMKLYHHGTSGYAEIAGYDPVETGYVIIHVKNYKVVDCERVVV